jgi:hypothetical protein
MDNTTTARIDLSRLQLLNDRLCQTLDALNQVRFSAHHVSAPTHVSHTGHGHGFGHTHAHPGMTHSHIGYGHAPHMTTHYTPHYAPHYTPNFGPAWGTTYAPTAAWGIYPTTVAPFGSFPFGTPGYATSGFATPAGYTAPTTSGYMPGFDGRGIPFATQTW